MYKKVDDKKYKDSNPEIIAWQRNFKGNSEDPLLFYFPQAGDSFKNKKFFAVKDYEKALFYDKGELVDILGGGIYELNKDARIKGTEIVWIDISLLEIPWGVPKRFGIPTKDGCMVGLHGDLKLRINDVKTFYNDIVSGKKEWNIKNLKDWIITLITTSLRDIFKKYSVTSILREERERIINLITSKMTEEFVRYGLELVTFNLIGIKTDEDVQKLLDQDRDKTIAISDACKDDLNNLLQRKSELQRRIKELIFKKNELQDKLLNDEITQEDYEKKKQQTQLFINEIEDELKKIEEIITNI
ncbi:MAG: SPFH domain-containing protein [Promethearchaeota archaeon]